MREGAGVGGRGRRVEFQVARHRDPQRAEPRQPLGVHRALGDAQRVAFEKRARGDGQPGPAPVRSLRHAPVDHDERDVSPSQFDHGVRPDFGFGEQNEVRPPMVEEAPQIAGHVEREELVQAAGRQAAGEKVGRGPGARGDEHLDAALGQPLHQRQERERLPDARPMQPGEAVARPRPAREPATLADARAVLLALAPPPGEQAGRQGLQQRQAAPVKGQGQRKPRCHASAPRLAGSGVRARAPGSREPTRA